MSSLLKHNMVSGVMAGKVEADSHHSTQVSLTDLWFANHVLGLDHHLGDRDSSSKHQQ